MRSPSQLNRYGIVLVFSLATVFVRADSGPLVLWYSRPAEKWVEALPLGNGQLGGMVFGGVVRERIQFNESTVWTGEPHDYTRANAAKFLPEIRRLLFEGKQKEAETLALANFMSLPVRQKAYQPTGDLLLELGEQDDAVEYRRELDLETAISTVSYKVGEVNFRREFLASAPGHVMAIRLTADRKGQLSFRARLETPHVRKRTLATNEAGRALNWCCTARSPKAQLNSRPRFGCCPKAVR